MPIETPSDVSLVRDGLKACQDDAGYAAWAREHGDDLCAYGLTEHSLRNAEFRRAERWKGAAVAAGVPDDGMLDSE